MNSIMGTKSTCLSVWQEICIHLAENDCCVTSERVKHQSSSVPIRKTNSIVIFSHYNQVSVYSELHLQNCKWSMWNSACDDFQWRATTRHVNLFVSYLLLFVSKPSALLLLCPAANIILTLFRLGSSEDLGENREKLGSFGREKLHKSLNYVPY